MRSFMMSLGTVSGMIVGVGFGLFVAYLVGMMMQADNPNDPSAGASGMLIGFLTVPAGLSFGIRYGMSIGAKLYDFVVAQE